MTLDVLGFEIFGVDFHVTSDKPSAFYNLYSEIISEVLNPLYLVLPIVNRLPWPARLRSLRKIAEFEALLADTIVTKSREMSQDADGGAHVMHSIDIITSLTKGLGEGAESLSTKEIRDGVNNLLFAGHDTTANALSFLLCHMAIYKDIQVKARNEVLRAIDAMPDTADPWAAFGDDQLAALPYCFNVIRESMRHEPVISCLTNRKLRGAYQYGDYVLPPGTKVGVHIYDLQHSPDYWGGSSVGGYDRGNDTGDRECDLDAFRPERFEAGPRRGKPDGVVAWIPFAMGSHQCVGMQFALREIRTAFAMLLYHYEWHLPKHSIHHNGLKTRLAPVTSAKNLQLCFIRRTII
ncbi:cytochrome P450 [Dimargaris cristalligena]|uniref:Cytochrome P450 n=1 Tax=Dimargaris cristalligena TaxID=215637 RepID=A0A4P9ZQA1_9FUNG|nr:cytochrome P450 [Dimargaris cristalligena]|eukprot:RKP35517.1 cytochrome P450 [Dimargaris cristalligena]